MKKPNFGIDAPNVVRNLIVIGFVLLLIACFFPTIEFSGAIIKTKGLMLPFCCTWATALIMLYYSKFAKLSHRDFILSLYPWKGAENVLDIGTGLGLLAIGCAKKTPYGKVIAIDIWNEQDLSGNIMERAKLNAFIEGVGKQVEFKTENILNTNFPDESFDVIVTNLCLHNIYNESDRKTACLEIFRLLKKNGQAIISDFKHINEYKNLFLKLGLSATIMKKYILNNFLLYVLPINTLVIKKS